MSAMTMTTAPAPTVIAYVVLSHAGPSGPPPGADQWVHPTATSFQLDSVRRSGLYPPWRSARRRPPPRQGPVGSRSRPRPAGCSARRGHTRLVALARTRCGTPGGFRRHPRHPPAARSGPRSPDHGTSGPRRVRTLLDNVASLFIVTGLLPGMKAGEPWLRRLQAP
ncbi:hypothetical protein SGL43_07045 [Streptomyces globisporus]|uniref:Uncharacterized protein n=1 Tax=Streptomyces globisporus TaxID=1908 RepID=A0ABM9H8L6_STRGL|nr:hypothetical protein SGL43_07045 [Streptomyces globisporus]